jgi:putative copper export protein
MASYLVMWIHLTAVAAWIGGMILVTFAVRPGLRRPGISSGEINSLRRIEDGSRTIRWVAIIALIITGFYNLLYEGASSRLESTWGALLMVKILIAAIAMGLTGVNDFIINAPSGKTALHAAVYSRWVSDAILALTLIILFIGVYLSRS